MVFFQQKLQSHYYQEFQLYIKNNNDLDNRISKNNLGIQIDQISEENILRIIDKLNNFKKIITK